MADNKRPLTLFLYVKGKEAKRIFNIPNFEEAVEIELIQSINGYRETLFEGRIETNSSNENQAQIDDDEFEANLQGVIEDQQEYEKEVEEQKEIENEYEEAIKEQDEKGRLKAQKAQEEENKRLEEMKKEVEEKKLKKQSTASEKKEFK